MATPTETPGVVRSLIPARIDRLPWSRFHTRMVVALGVAWILDGLEITVASSVTDVLTSPETLGLSSTAAGSSPPCTSRARSSARCSSAGCPTSSAAATSS